MSGLPEAFRKKAIARLGQRRELNVGRLVAEKVLSTANEISATKALTSDTAVIPYKDYYTLSNGVYSRVQSQKSADLSNY